jgi:hypothetical protein
VGNLGATGAAKEFGGHVHWDLYRVMQAGESSGPLRPITYAGKQWRKVDPWPLLVQNYVAPPDTSTASPEEDMPTFSGSAFAVDPSVPRYHLVVDANFRAQPTTKSPSFGVIPAGSVVPVAYWVDGESLNGDDQWAIAWLYVGQYREGFFHRSVLGAPQQAPALDCSSQVKAATAPLQTEITALSTRIANAKKALG